MINPVRPGFLERSEAPAYRPRTQQVGPTTILPLCEFENGLAEAECLIDEFTQLACRIDVAIARGKQIISIVWDRPYEGVPCFRSYETAASPGDLPAEMLGKARPRSGEIIGRDVEGEFPARIVVDLRKIWRRDLAAPEMVRGKLLVWIHFAAPRRPSKASQSIAP